MSNNLTTPWLRYLYYRKSGLIENERINCNKVTLELKNGKTVVILIDESDRRKILLT